MSNMTENRTDLTQAESSLSIGGKRNPRGRAISKPQVESMRKHHLDEFGLKFVCLLRLI